MIATNCQTHYLINASNCWHYWPEVEDNEMFLERPPLTQLIVYRTLPV